MEKKDVDYRERLDQTVHIGVVFAPCACQPPSFIAAISSSQLLKSPIGAVCLALGRLVALQYNLNTTLNFAVVRKALRHNASAKEQ